MKARRTTGAAVLAVILSAVIAACGSSDGSGPIIARVDGRPIHQSVADARIAGIGQVHGDDIAAALGEDWRTTVLRTLTDDIIMQIEAEARGVEVSNAEVDQELDDLRTAVGTDEEWEAWLTRNGIDEGEARRRLLLQETSSRVYRAITEGVQATEADAEAYYEANPDKFTTSDGLLPFLEVRNSLIDTLTGDMQEEAFADWLEQRRGNVEIEVLADEWK